MATFFVSLADMTTAVWIGIAVFVVLLAVYTQLRWKRVETLQAKV